MKKTTILSVMAVLWPIANKDKRTRSKDTRTRIKEQETRNKDKGTKLKALLLLALLYFIMGQLQAQENKAVDVTLKGIQIGQQVPDVTITGLHNYKDANGKAATTAKISDFKGKLLILDFWATWCSPCIAMIPKMDSLQKQFGDQIQFLSVTYQSDKEVLPFLEKFEKQQGRKFNLPVVTASKQLHRLFPHVYLPHYVWVDGSGAVKAITGFEEVNTANIEMALSSSVKLAQKKDMKIAYNNKKPFLINGNGGDASNLIYHSIFTGYNEGVGSGYSFVVDDNDPPKITARNQTIIQLYKLAYGAGKEWFNNNRVEIKVKDHNRLVRNRDSVPLTEWRFNNMYCYELLQSKDQANIFEQMQRELRHLFPYDVSMEQVTKKCLVLIRTTNQDRLATKGGSPSWKFSSSEVHMVNAPLNILIGHLDVQYFRDSQYPILNETGYIKRVDMDINAKLSDIDELNKALALYDLKFIIAMREVSVLTIRDRKPNYQTSTNR